jgi:hypothetical protein
MAQIVFTHSENQLFLKLKYFLFAKTYKCVDGQFEIGGKGRSKCCQLLSEQSKIMELLYERLVADSLWHTFLHLETLITPVIAGQSLLILNSCHFIFFL